LVATLTPALAVAPPPKPLPALPQAAAPAPSAPTAPTVRPASPPPSAPPYAAPPPQPPNRVERETVFVRRPSRTGLLLGGHVGWMLGGGQLPIDSGTSLDTNVVAAGGLAYGFDGGLRFGRQWYVGLDVEHAELAHGDLSSTPDVTDANASTTLVTVVLAFIGNPDLASFYGEVGVGERWFSFTATTSLGQVNTSFNAADLTLGAGVWLPVGPSLRLLPKLSVSVGSFDPPGGGTSETHSFILLGMAGFYNLDF
ncbi:MAG TPA: hypothetical protein VN894_01940, partial [Polyangiaceae bacterium]|nr:hypothetical protein [Polyangiaceae bacterium]